MASVGYNEIQSRFMAQVQAHDLAAMPDDMLASLFYEWVHSSLSKQHILNLFGELSIDDDIQEINYELSYPSGIEDADKDFVIEILARDFTLSWTKQQIQSLVNTQQVFGSKEEKFYSQKEHLKGLLDLQKEVIKEQKSLIADRNIMYNEYL